MQNLTISLVQTSLIWENPIANLAHFDELLASNDLSHTDLIVLPEMFTTGFSMEVEKLAEAVDGLTTKWLIDQSQKLNTAICGSIIIEDKQKYYNRMLFVEPDGKVSTYDKRHLFRMAGEDAFFAPGMSPTIVDYKGWKLNLQICYDLRFPVWARNQQNYDALIYIANWPSVRKEPWQVLLKARAIENLSYVIGVNRVGQDENGLEYSGNSVVIDPKGKEIGSFQEGIEGVNTIELNHSELNNFRTKFPAHKDQDNFHILELP